MGTAGNSSGGESVPPRPVRPSRVSTGLGVTSCSSDAEVFWFWFWFWCWLPVVGLGPMLWVPGITSSHGDGGGTATGEGVGVRCPRMRPRRDPPGVRGGPEDDPGVAPGVVGVPRVVR